MRCAHALAAACLGAFACGGSSPEAAQPVVTVSSDVRAAPTAAPLTSAPPSTSASARAVRHPPLARPDGMREDHFALLGDLCALGWYRFPDGDVRFGCRSQPPFDHPKEQPDGQVVEVPDIYDLCTISAVHRGAFSKPGVEQAIVAFDLCKTDEGEFLNGSQPGSAMLVESVDAKWRYVAEEMDLNAIDCDPVAQPSGQALLVCTDNFGAFGDGAVRWLFTLDFSKPSGSRLRSFGSVYFNGFSIRCGPGEASPFLEYGVTDATFGKRTVTDFDGDGALDLELAVERAHVEPSRALDRRIEQACVGAPELDSRRLLPKPTKHTLRWKGGAGAFAPTAETQKLFDAWRKQSSEFWLRGDGG